MVGGLFFQLKLKKWEWDGHTPKDLESSVCHGRVEQPPTFQTWQNTYKREGELGMKYTIINSRVFLTVLNVFATTEWKVTQSPQSQKEDPAVRNSCLGPFWCTFALRLCLLPGGSAKGMAKAVLLRQLSCCLKVAVQSVFQSGLVSHKSAQVHLQASCISKDGS